MRTACSMSCGISEVRGEQVRGAGRDDRERGLRAVAARRCTAAPSRRRPRRRRGPRPPRALASTCFGAFRLFGTSCQIGSGTPWRSSSRRSSSRPPPKDLPACATTATRARSRGARLRASARDTTSVTRASRIASSSAAMPMQQPRERVGRMVHPAVHPRDGDDRRDRERAEPDEHLLPRRGHPRGQQEREARVEREPGRGVTGRVARVDRERLEPVRRPGGRGSRRTPSRDRSRIR